MTPEIAETVARMTAPGVVWEIREMMSDKTGQDCIVLEARFPDGSHDHVLHFPRTSDPMPRIGEVQELCRDIQKRVDMWCGLGAQR